MEPLNRKILLATHADLIKRGVEYGYGAKAEGGSDPRNGHRWNRNSTGKLSTPVSTIENIDCSGLIRYEAYLASGGKLRLPDGSQSQLDWCRENLRRIDYDECGQKDNVLRIAFMSPGVHGVGSIGHVWWTFNANTLESYGGHGAGSHKWSVYADRVSGCFEVPSYSGVTAKPAVSTPDKPAPKQPEIILAYYEGDNIKAERFPVELHDNKSFVQEHIRKIIAALGVEVADAEWGDGTPALIRKG